MRAKKEKIAENEVAGGLFDLKQLYEIFYIEKERHYTDKISLEITLRREGEKQKYARRSLRFSSHEQFWLFILDCIKAYVKFLKARGIMNLSNWQTLKWDRLRRIDEVIEREFRNSNKFKNYKI